jgi:putative spermidine/putrescine transport system substrate-binding protein
MPWPAGIAAFALAAFSFGSALAQPQSGKPPLTVVSWGGALTKSHMLAFVRPYRKTTGRWVNVEDYDGGLDEIRDQVESLNVKWDVVSLGLPNAIRGCREGLLEPLDHKDLTAAPDGTPARQDFYDVALQDCAVGYNIWATVVAYSPGKFRGTKPAALADFFDLDRFPGRRGMERTPVINLEWALIVDGVDPDQVYETLSTGPGLARAFGVLDRIKSEIVWWSKGAEPPRLLSSGEVAMTTAWNGRIFEAVKDRRADSVILWDRAIWSLDTWGIPKGSDNLAEALDFIAFATEPRRLAEQAGYVAYGPARRSAAALVAKDIQPHLPTEEANAANALRINYAWWVENRPRIERRFADWIEQERFVYEFQAPDSH